MGNDALDTNRVVGQQADLAITTHGSDWYFTVCAVMGFSTLVFMGWSFTKPHSHRLFHYITALITLCAGIAYYSMGSGLGQVPVQVEFVRPDSSEVGAAGTREMFYARYIDWFITTPLLLTDLLLTAGLPWPSILVTILADEVMIVSGLIGAFTQTRYKWGYWVFGTADFFYVVYTLLWNGRRHANALGGSISTTYNACGVLTIFIWFLYPIAWGLAEGGNVIHPDSEAIFYGVLDIIAKPIFGFMLLAGHRNIDPSALGLHIREPGMGKSNGPDMQHSGQHGHLAGNGSQPAATTAPAAQPATATA
jgi:bacteriorhodopsin